MDQALKIAKLVAFSSLAFLCFAMTIAVLDARVAIDSAKADVHGLTVKAGDTLDGVKVGSDRISSQAVQTMIAASETLHQAKTTIAKADPAIAELHSVLKEGYSVEHDARLSLDNVNKAAIDERMYFERDLPPLMDAIKVDVVDAGDTMTAAKALITDPNLKRFLADSADMTDSGKKILQDGADETHKLVHPDKKKLGFWGSVYAVVKVAQHFEPSIF